ncbi:hypothetical protein OX88_27645, partial [Pseudomonas coronafaciens pv. porri]
MHWKCGESDWQWGAGINHLYGEKLKKRKIISSQYIHKILKTIQIHCYLEKILEALIPVLRFSTQLEN